MTSEICGITPEHCTARQKISASPASAPTPSWLRAAREQLALGALALDRPLASLVLRLVAQRLEPLELGLGRVLRGRHRDGAYSAHPLSRLHHRLGGEDAVGGVRRHGDGGDARTRAR